MPLWLSHKPGIENQLGHQSPARQVLTDPAGSSSLALSVWHAQAIQACQILRCYAAALTCPIGSALRVPLVVLRASVTNFACSISSLVIEQIVFTIAAFALAFCGVEVPALRASSSSNKDSVNPREFLSVVIFQSPNLRPFLLCGWTHCRNCYCPLSAAYLSLHVRCSVTLLVAISRSKLG